MSELEDLKKEIHNIQVRNKRVEADKAWETSWTRRLLLLVLTYITILVFFLFAHLPNPFVNALVPSLAFILSTLSFSIAKKYWLRRNP